MRGVTLLLAACLAASANALYSSSDDVIHVTSKKEFSQAVAKADGVQIVEFYAPWCGHCKNLAPEWKKAATALKGVANVVAVDATANDAQALASKYGVQGFPTIKVFGANKRSPTDYQGARDAKAIVQAVLKEVKNSVMDKMGGGGGGGKRRTSSGGGGGGGGGGSRKRASETGGGSDVITLTGSNFDDEVMGSNDGWLVEFYAPWCGHCKNLAPEWASAAQQLSGEVKLGAVDATEHGGLGQRFEVQGYPTIKWFPPGAKAGDDAAEDYMGPREAAGIVEWALSKMEAAGVTQGVAQLTSPKQWSDTCGKNVAGGKRLCVVAVLRDLLDDGASGRNTYIEMLEEVAKKNRKSPFRFFWTAAGDQPALEEALGVAGNAPTVAAVSMNKGGVAVHTGAFDSKAINRFLTGLMTGRTKSSKMGGKVKVVKVSEWDGGEAAVEMEEEFSLDDIMNEEL